MKKILGYIATITLVIMMVGCTSNRYMTTMHVNPLTPCPNYGLVKTVTVIGSPSITTVYTYYADGRIAAAVNPNSTVHYDYSNPAWVKETLSSSGIHTTNYYLLDGMGYAKSSGSTPSSQIHTYTFSHGVWMQMDTYVNTYVNGNLVNQPTQNGTWDYTFWDGSAGLSNPYGNTLPSNIRDCRDFGMAWFPRARNHNWTYTQQNGSQHWTIYPNRLAGC